MFVISSSVKNGMLSFIISKASWPLKSKWDNDANISSGLIETVVDSEAVVAKVLDKSSVITSNVIGSAEVLVDAGVDMLQENIEQMHKIRMSPTESYLKFFFIF